MQFLCCYTFFLAVSNLDVLSYTGLHSEYGTALLLGMKNRLWEEEYGFYPGKVQTKF